MIKHSDDEINVHVGNRLMTRRDQLDLSVRDLGVRVGLPSATLETIERGAKGISAEQLLNLARALDVPVTYFFDGLDPTCDDSPLWDAPEPGQRQEAEEFLCAYSKVTDLSIRRKVSALVQQLADPDEEFNSPQDD